MDLLNFFKINSKMNSLLHTEWFGGKFLFSKTIILKQNWIAKILLRKFLFSFGERDLGIGA
jgi:hypothetical protein